MRARLIALLAAGATIVVASLAIAQDRQAFQSRQIASPTTTTSLPQLAEQIPDGADLIDLYKSARTVTDVEAANGKVKAEVGRAQLVASDLARLHTAKMTTCDDVEESHLEATAAKARSLSATLARIDSELTKSLAVMRQKLAPLSSMRAKDDVNRYTVAVHELGRLNVQTQELAKAIQGVARSNRTAAESCIPTPIPSLFADGGTPSGRVVSLTRSRPTPRKRPANAAVRRAPLLFRYY